MEREDCPSPLKVSMDAAMDNTPGESVDLLCNDSDRLEPSPPCERSSLACHTNITQLPGLVLILIFSFLDTEDKGLVARTCSHWRQLVYTTSLWTHAVAKLDILWPSSELFTSLQARRIRQARFVLMNRAEDLMDFLHTVSCVEVLDFSHCPWCELIIQALNSQSLPCLKHLKLRVNVVDGNTLQVLAKHATSLKRLELKVLYDIEDIFSIFSTLKSVPEFVIKKNGAFFEVNNVPSQLMEMPWVTEVNLKRIFVGDNVLTYLRKSFPNLQKLGVSLLKDVTQSGLQEIGRMTQLEHLNLRGAFGGDGWILSFCNESSRLRVLKLNLLDLCDSNLQLVAQLPFLEELRLWARARGIKEEGWANLTRVCQRLRKLSLVSCGSVTSKIAKHLSKLTSVKELELLNNLVLTPSSQHLCQAFLQVTNLSLIMCTLEAESFKSLAQLPALMKLVIGSFTNIEDQGLKYLSEGMAPLQDVQLSDLERITDSGLVYLCSKKRTLKRLHVRGCESVTDLGILEASKELQDLRVLEAQISPEAKKILRRARPGLTVTRYHY